ncbi:MAG: glycosyltransferase family 4 protein [Haliscomenobacter sp.]|uniref:glycosyltransferase family 4 protein n=1 Tax=Haliscomenobacter sp. TaxID=2717303 RepID=UPI0029A084C9|nr:glycosyltransferase family 4 protein [Haliscomenobacter sp.]MDX2072288.1 glycosyltransferase family 4 protein [Haliscomenobacter sp.]
MKRVAIIQRTLVQYRQEFFDGLKNALAKEGVELTLIYGKQSNEEGLKKDEVELSWSKYVPNIEIKFGGRTLIWQPCLQELKGKDLIIVESANKLILNYLLMISRRVFKAKLGFWGHGRNRQDTENSFANQFKYLFLKQCDWWFAYTSGVKDFLIEKGYPQSQITIVQNAIDTQFIQQEYAQTTELEVMELKKELGIEGEQVGIFCGGIYPEKRIDFLLEACLNIKKEVPNFHMIFIGSGIDALKITNAAMQYPWIHYVGPKFGKDRVKYFKISTLFLMPGLVGLGILDAFALETPIVTTRYEFHSPEIEYLEHGKNGLIVANTIDQYSRAVIQLLLSGDYVQMLGNCRESAKKYTIETMVENFKTGILQALN